MIYFLFGVHNHQPVGNFDAVMEKAYHRAYAPFLEVLTKHPRIRMSMHCSGVLLEWLSSHHADYISHLKELCLAGQVELMAGGFFEPVITAIPGRDQKGQILRMKRFLQKEMGQSPEGLWLAERVWEPQLARLLNQLGLEYTIVDDVHFLSVGFEERDLYGYYLTEAEGHSVRIFPILKKLRYMIPFAEPEAVFQYFRDISSVQKTSGAALVMADDGEKFGLWPKTYEWVYEKGWLDKFFSLLEQNSDWVQTLTFSNYARQFPPKGWAYLPTGSYTELSEWSLGAEAGMELSRIREQMPDSAARFLRGGYFRNFLSKYPEASRMYRKMIRISAGVHALRGGKTTQIKERALDQLWRGQCNCAYWHGVFGGLYLPHLRHAVYRHLLQAERLVSEASADPKKFVVSQEDWDADGHSEILLESAKANWYLAPGKGGGMWEWDIVDKGVNLCGLMSRHKEGYHSRLKLAAALPTTRSREVQSIHDGVLVKEPGLEKLLFYDWHARMIFLDHFLHSDTTLDAFSRAQYGEQGDFVQGVYHCPTPVVGSEGIRLILSRQGTVWIQEKGAPVRVMKEILFHYDGSWDCTYEIQNCSKEPIRLWFGSEMALALTESRDGHPLEQENISQHRVVDDSIGLRIVFNWREPVDLWRFPLYTISQSEEGFEKTYQGNIFLAHKKMMLGAGETAKIFQSARVDVRVTG
ncbi:MAG: DUF1926 domain-containing protein [Elusimicrobia bacterium]|nr:DUF1926 domain-containing protein [Elusimicrobiota bacterium]